MTQHPAEGVLQAYLDGEVVSDPREVVDRHLASCSACRERLNELHQLASSVREAVAVVDSGAPDLGAVIWDVRRIRGRRRSRTQRGRVAVAASLVLLVGAGWSLAMPGSPLRRLLDRAESEPTPMALGQSDTAAEASFGPMEVGVTPANGAVLVSFTDVSPGSGVEVRAADGEVVVVSAPGGSRFAAAEGSVRVEAAPGPGELSVAVPTALPNVELRVDGQILYQKVEGVVSFPGPEPAISPDGVARIEISG